METLNSLASFEGVDGKVCELPQLRVWSNSLPSRLAPASGSGAAPSINAGHVMMHISDLLAILQPLVSFTPYYYHSLSSDRTFLFSLEQAQSRVSKSSLFLPPSRHRGAASSSVST